MKLLAILVVVLVVLPLAFALLVGPIPRLRDRLEPPPVNEDFPEDKPMNECQHDWMGPTDESAPICRKCETVMSGDVAPLGRGEKGRCVHCQGTWADHFDPWLASATCPRFERAPSRLRQVLARAVARLQGTH